MEGIGLSGGTEAVPGAQRMGTITVPLELPSACRRKGTRESLFSAVFFFPHPRRHVPVPLGYPTVYDCIVSCSNVHEVA